MPMRAVCITFFNAISLLHGILMETPNSIYSVSIVY